MGAVLIKFQKHLIEIKIPQLLPPQIKFILSNQKLDNSIQIQKQSLSIFQMVKHDEELHLFLQCNNSS